MVVPRVASEYGYADLDRDFRDLEDLIFTWKQGS